MKKAPKEGALNLIQIPLMKNKIRNGNLLN